jgi:DnaJ-class molecular chaperone
MGEGEDPCHRCKGTGKEASGQECAACKGGGKTLTGKQDKDGEDVVADCEICDGEGEVSATIKRMVACDTCSGSGKVQR